MTLRLWKCRAVDAEENQNQVSLGAHRPWKSLCDSHIPTASMTAFVPLQKRRPSSEIISSFRLILQ